MYKIEVMEGQSIIDIALEQYGSVAGLVTLARDNNLSITQELDVDVPLLIDESKVINRDMVRYFRQENISINTGGSLSEFNNDFNKDFLIK